MKKLELDERARRRGGILTVADLDAAGLSETAIRRAIAAGRLVRLRRGVFTTTQILAGFADDRWEQHGLEVRGALAVAGDTAVAAGASAAALHRLDMLGDPPARPIIARPIEVSANGKRSTTTSGRVARLPESHLISLNGWPTTDLARTVIDVARRQGERCAVVAGDAALRSGLDRPDLDRVLADCSRAPGIRIAREALTLCDARAESPLESLARLVLIRGGVPEPQLQTTIGRYRADFCWPAARVILEADGRLKYVEGTDLIREKEREDWLRLQAYTVLRTDWTEVFHRPMHLCRRVMQSLASAAEARARSFERTRYPQPVGAEGGDRLGNN